MTEVLGNIPEDHCVALYVGEAKACALNAFVAQALERMEGAAATVVSIMPDVLSAYPVPHVIALNPEAEQLSRECGRPVALRLPMPTFLKHMGTSAEVRRLVDSLLARQDAVWLWMFESLALPAFLQDRRVWRWGPEPNLVRTCNSKVWQYRTLKDVVPVPDYRVCAGARALRSSAAELRRSWRDGIFVSTEFSAGGAGSMVTHDDGALRRRFTSPSAAYLLSRYVPHEHDPTVLGVVVNDQDVVIAGVADQTIERGTRFCGSTYPSVLPADLQTCLARYTLGVGRRLGSLGYRGIFGCDFVVDRNGRVTFVEVNPRKQGTTMEFCCALEIETGRASPTLLDIECAALRHGRLPRNMELPSPHNRHIHWGTYNLKAHDRVLTRTGLSQVMLERRLFARVWKEGKGGHLFLEHVGAGVQVEPGAFVGRVVAVDTTREKMLARLQQARQGLRESLTTEQDKCQPESAHDM